MIGLGILNGMAVTLRNFIGSYFEGDRLITVQYPEERSPLPPGDSRSASS
jgi:NADH-quinone oxidoreductase subunit I